MSFRRPSGLRNLLSVRADVTAGSPPLKRFGMTVVFGCFGQAFNWRLWLRIMLRFKKSDVIPKTFRSEEPAFHSRSHKSRFLTAKAVRNDNNFWVLWTGV